MIWRQGEGENGGGNGCGPAPPAHRNPLAALPPSLLRSKSAVSKSSSKEREVRDAYDTCSKDAIPERCSDAKIAFVVSIVVHRVMEARTIETGAWRRHPEMNRVMYQEIDG